MRRDFEVGQPHQLCVPYFGTHFDPANSKHDHISESAQHMKPWWESLTSRLVQNRFIKTVQNMQNVLCFEESNWLAILATLAVAQHFHHLQKHL